MYFLSLIILLNACSTAVSIKIILYLDSIDDIRNHCLTIGSALYTGNNEIKLIFRRNESDTGKMRLFYNEMLLLNNNETVLISDGHSIIQRGINENDHYDESQITFPTENGCWPFTHPHPSIYNCPLMQGEKYVQNRGKETPKACSMLREKAEKIDEVNKDRLSIYLNSGLSIGKVHQFKRLFNATIKLDSSLPALCKHYVGLLSWLYLQEEHGIQLDYDKKILVLANQNHLNFKFDYKTGLWMFGEGNKANNPVAIRFHGVEMYYDFFYHALHDYYSKRNTSIMDKTINVDGNNKTFRDVCINENDNTSHVEYQDDTCMFGYSIISKYESFMSEFTQWRFGCMCITGTKKVELKGWINVQPYGFYKGQMLKFFGDVSLSSELSATGCGFVRLQDDGSLPVELAEELLYNGSPMLSHSFLKPARSIIFYPDFHFIEGYGFKDIINKIAVSSKAHMFDHQIKQVFWRGSTTGEINGNCFDMPRYKVCNLSASLPWCNFKISKILPGHSCNNVNISKELLSSRVDEWNWLNYTGILNIDGHVNAWGLLWRLASKSTVFSVESEFTNPYIELMIPWQHYIPIKADLSDLEEQTKIIISKNLSDILFLKNIVENANKLAKSFTYESEVDRVARELSVVWQLKDD